MNLLFNDTGTWTQVKDGNKVALALFNRHYSKYHYKDGRRPSRFVGPGERIVLLSKCNKAIFVWRKFISKDGQDGVNCSVFRNESKSLLSSELIKEAELIAKNRWPGQRFYTYVNPRKVRSSNPGYCFKCAGWRFYGVTKKRKYLIFEKIESIQLSVNGKPAAAGKK